MKYARLMFTVAVCLTLALPLYAQISRSGEGVARQVTALKNMMENSANLLRNRITTVENDIVSVQNSLSAVQNTLTAAQNQINALTAEENQRKACNNQKGDTSIYWPKHPDADGKGCVSHSDLGGDSTDVAAGQPCQGKSISWTVGKYKCARNAASTPEGLSVSFNYNTAQAPSCGNRTTYGMQGRAKFKCVQGKFVRDKSVSLVCQPVTKSYKDWGANCR